MPLFNSHFQLDFDFEDISYSSNYTELLVLLCDGPPIQLKIVLMMG